MNKLKTAIYKNRIILFLLVSYLVVFFAQGKISSFLGNQIVQSQISNAIYSGWLGLADYLSAHVLFCLIPAFFIAGAINSLIDSQIIIKYLSGQTRKWLAYIITAVGGFFIEVCSCTILPLFAGIWKKGAGLGIAITFLYAGPAINLVAFILTGQRLGWDFGVARLVFSISFAILVGIVMEIIFGNGREKGDLRFTPPDDKTLTKKQTLTFWMTLFSIFIIGTAPISNFLRMLTIFPLIIFQVVISIKWLKKEKRIKWWEETLKFFNQIIPLLLIGVFLASFITHLIPQEKFQNITGRNTILTNLIAVLFGAIAYFPALVEIPIAENFLALGMHKGPLMAYLLADPVLSLQGLLIISRILGVKKTIVYAVIIIVLTTISGYIFGLL